MSHLSKIELQVTDIDTLARASRRMGFTLNQGQTQFKWYGKAAPCDHAIKIPNADYEIGVIRNAGQFELNCDYFDRKLTQAIGENGGRLKQAYAIEKTKQVARQKGYTAIERESNQNIQLRITIP